MFGATFMLRPVVRLAHQRTMATAKKAARDRTFKDSYLCDPATYPIIAIIFGRFLVVFRHPRHKKHSKSSSLDVAEPSVAGRAILDAMIGNLLFISLTSRCQTRCHIGALGLAAFTGMRTLAKNPDVRVRKTLRTQIIRDWS